MTKYDLAEIIHDKDCRLNHIDQCGWMYENDPKHDSTKWKVGWAHANYLDRAEKLIDKLQMDPKDIAKVIEAL